MNLPDLCRACGGKCCTNPFMGTDEYARLAMAIGNERLMAAVPVRISGGWMFREGRCPGATDTGCVLPYGERPLICRTYPFIPCQVIGKNMQRQTIFLLRVDTCPHWQEFGKHIDDVKNEVAKNGIQ